MNGYDNASGTGCEPDASAGRILRYSTRLGNCAVLGPGQRAVLWVYGCCFSCPGCIGENYKTGKWTQTTPEEAAAWFLRQKADGLTISGGEPMLQAAALDEMLSRIRAERDCGVIVYTGFVYEKLLEMSLYDPDLKHFLHSIDLLIDGPYIRELDRNQPYRGSENQRIFPLTDRYVSDIESYYHSATERKIEIHLSEQFTLMAGVPGQDQARVWKKIKQLGGDA